MHTTASFFRTWGPSLLVMALIFAFSSIPSTEAPSFDLPDFLFKKGGHVVGYALLALLNVMALQKSQGGHKIRPYILSWVMALLYAMTDEFHQSFVPGRGSALMDVGIDALGAVLGLSLWAWYQARKQKSGG